MNTKTTVWITTSFEGFHRWKQASLDVGYLKNFHRHIFHVKMGLLVAHLDRDVEFITLKKQVNEYLESRYAGKEFDGSCEMIANDLLEHFKARFVEVSEDGENGAIVELDKELPAWENAGRCFLGIEAEGPWRGARTLFVPGSVSKDRFLKVYEKVKGVIEAVYYGAGNDRTDDPLTWAMIKEVCMNDEKVCSKEFVNGQVIGVDIQGEGTLLKQVTDTAIIFTRSPNERYVTFKSDPLYQSDQYVE